MSVLLRRIQELDASSLAPSFTGLIIDNESVGQVHSSLVDELLAIQPLTHEPCFQKATINDVEYIELKNSSNAQKVMDAVTQMLLDKGIIAKRHGDLVQVSVQVTVDRNTAPHLGIPSVGVHLNCWSNDGNYLWMAQRASNKSTFPNCWDTTVAGGQPCSLTKFENLQKEAFEEAGIAPSLVKQYAKSVSCQTQMTCNDDDGRCLKYSIYYCWDLQVDNDFEPTPTDGEVSQFAKWSFSKLLEEVKSGNNIRPAMRLVVTDFLIRHGVITPDNEPSYAEVQAAMHRERLSFS